MSRIPARLGIAFGQVALMVSVLLLAIAIGLVPSERNAIVQGRAALCESIAVGTSVCATRGDMPGLRAVLEGTVRRNADILSAAVRDAGGSLVAEVGEHQAHWERPEDGAAVDSYVYVPIYANDAKWGTVEVRFSPLGRTGVLGFLFQPSVRLVLFASGACFVLFLFYLRKMLQHLDPSKVVPGRVRTALDTLAEGLLVIDNQGRIVLANQALSEVVGRSAEELLGRRADQLGWSATPANGSDPVRVAESDLPWARAARTAAPQRHDVLHLQAKGGRRTFSVNCTPVLGADGKYRGVLASFDDVTLLEAKEAELRKSKQAAESANQAKSEFLARMSHEIRTPMNAILGFTEVLRRGFEESEAERRDYLNTIHASGQHLLELINDILDLSKIESGRMEVERTRCSPHEVISEVVSVLWVRAREKCIGLEYAWDGGLPETVLTDPTRLRQIVTNLVGNAIKFTEGGAVRVVARMSRNDAGAAKLAVDVVDTGIGIEHEALSRIFQPFAQADTSVTRRFGGTGLGLAISRQLAEALGGGVTVRSRVGEGSVFTLTIDAGSLDGVPVLDTKPAEGTSWRGPGQEHPAAAARPRRLPPCRVLVVEDGLSNQKLITLVLQRAGATVDAAPNGAVGVEMATRGRYDAVLMDMQMPVMDGYTAAGILRRQGLTVPIIALTAHAMKGEEEKCRAAGCSGYLPKPIDMDLLIATLADAVAGEAAAALPPAQDEQTVPPATPAPRSAAAADVRLTSSLPTDDPEFREIVVEFADRLRGQLTAMESAWAERDLGQLAGLAHWLKGSGGTAGFASFTDPAAKLERLVKASAAAVAGGPPVEERLREIEAAIGELTDLAARVAVPESLLPASAT